MQSQKSIEIQRLRGIILNDSESPVERLVAARRLLSRYGPSERNVPVIRRVIKLFERDANADVGDRCLKLKAQLLKRLDLQEIARVPIDDAEDQSIVDVEPSTSKAPEESAPPQQQPDSDDTFAVEFPPRHLLWPPDPTVYVPGWIDTKLVAQRLIVGGARDLNPAPSRSDISDRIIRTALGPNYSYAELTLDLLQRLWLGLQGYEPRGEDPMMAGQRHRFWPWQKLFSAVFYVSTAECGYGSLHDPPPDPIFVRELIKQSPESAYVRLEQLPRAIEAIKHYGHLPIFAELIKEIDKEKHQ